MRVPFYVGLFAALVGCQVGEGYKRPQLKADEVAGWNGRLDGVLSAGDLDPQLLARWWQSLRDPTLNQLMQLAAKANLDLRTAQAQLRRARAQRNLTKADRSPTVGVGGSANRSGRSGSASTLYSASLDASWELDVFGGIGRNIEAAQADLQAAEETRRDVLVTILAEVGLNYAELRTLVRRKTIALQNLKAQEQYSAVLVAKLREGAVSSLEVDSAKSNLEKTRSSIPDLDRQIQQSKNRLAVLVGKAPGRLDSMLAATKPVQVPAAKIAVGVPAEVLRRRPDVRRAERQLAAETARVGVAIADLYPKFALNGTVGLESASLSSLFKSASGLFGFGPGASWNLYDGGRTRQRIEIQSATQEEALVNYEHTVLKALEDVENAIVAFTQEHLRRQSLGRSAEAARQAAKVARSRYDAGVSDFLSALDAQRSKLAAEDELARSEGTILTSLIRLYKALGGGWDPEEPTRK